MATMILAADLAEPGQASAQGSAERITSYYAQVTVQHDGSTLVSEQITYDFGADRRHGIFRVIPVRFRYNGGYDRIYPIDVQSVRSDNAAGQYSVDSNGSSVSIRIGNPDQTVTGTHRYMITYVVRGSLNAFANQDELSWNVVGNPWQGPDRIFIIALKRRAIPVACFAVALGSTGACQHAAIANEVASFSQNGLGPGEGLTVVVGIPKGVVASPGPILQERWSLPRAFALTPLSAGASGGLLAILLVLGAVVLVRARGLYATPIPLQIFAYQTSRLLGTDAARQVMGQGTLMGGRIHELIRIRSAQLGECQPCIQSRKNDSITEEDVACLL
jgi:hypothetical protein